MYFYIGIVAIDLWLYVNFEMTHQGIDSVPLT